MKIRNASRFRRTALEMGANILEGIQSILSEFDTWGEVADQESD